MQGPIDTWKAVTQEFWKGPGNALVTGSYPEAIIPHISLVIVSAHKPIRTEIRKVIQANMEDIVDLVELPFQPDFTRPVFTPGKKHSMIEKV